MRGADELRRARPIAEGLAHFGDEIREIGFGDEGLGPEALLQLHFGEHFRAIRDEGQEELERLRREVNLAAALGQLPGVAIEDERTESNLHARIL